MKKITSLLMMLCVFVGTAWADFTQTYTSDGVHWNAIDDVATLSGGLKDVITTHGCDGTVHYGYNEVIVASEGDITVTVDYTSGSHKIVILGVELVNASGDVVKSDYHYGDSGSGDNNNVYTLSGVAAGEYLAKYYVCNKPNDHSLTATNGQVLFVGDVTEKTYDPEISTEYYYQIKNVAYSRMLSANPNYSTVAAMKNADDPAQFWALEEAGDGTYYLRNAGQRKYLGYNQNNNQAWPVDATASAKFTLEVMKRATKQYAAHFAIKKSDGDEYSNAHDANWGYANGQQVVRWLASAAASQWVFEKTDVSVETAGAAYTYSITLGGAVKLTQTYTGWPGDGYSELPALPFGVSGTKPEGVIAEEDHGATKTIEATENLPFAYAANYESINHWYYLKFDGNKFIHHDEGQNHIDLNSTSVDENNKDIYTWAFVGDPFNGYKIVNRYAGEGYILSSSTTMSGTTGADTWPIMTAEASLPSGNNTLWIPTASTHADNGFYLEQKGHANNKMNNRGSKLAYWTGGAGSGSTFTVQERPVFVTDVEGLSNNVTYNLTTSRGWLIYNSENPGNVSSTACYTTFTKGVNVDACQWAIYKSVTGKYYLYNVGAGRFVGTSNGDIPFVEDPTNNISILSSTKDGYPFLFSVDGTGTIDHYNTTKVPGVANWSAGLSNTGSDGSAHKIAEAGTLDEATLAAIAEKVRVYEGSQMLAEVKALCLTVEADGNKTVGQYKLSSLLELALAADLYKATPNEENFNTLLAAYNDLLENGEKVTLTSGEVFTVKCYDANRGYMVYSTAADKGSETQAYLAGTNNGAHPAIDGDGVYKEWALFTYGGKNYIYNVQNKKFITSDGVVQFSDTPYALELIDINDCLTEVKFENNKYLSFSPGWGANCVRTESGIDDGCKFYIVKTGAVVEDEETLNTIQSSFIAAWKVDALKTLGCVGGYSVTEDEINQVTNFTQVEALNENSVIAFNPNAYYRIVSAATTESRGEDVTVCVDRTDNWVKWVSGTASNSVNNIWKFVPAATPGKYYIQAANGGYAQAPKGGSAKMYLVDAENQAGQYEVSPYDGHLANYRLRTGSDQPNHFWADGNNVICGWENGYTSNSSWYLIPATELDVIVTAAGYATLHLPFAVEVPNNLKAYAVTSVNATSANLDPKTVIPANEGVILEGTGEHKLTITTADAWTAEANLLEGSNVNTYVAGDAYVLGIPEGETEAMFAKAVLNKNAAGEPGDSHFLNNANKAYLPTTSGASLVLRFNFGGNTTAIESVLNGVDANAPIYDLSGRRVNNAVKGGIYIQNGKKFIVK